MDTIKRKNQTKNDKQIKRERERERENYAYNGKENVKFIVRCWE